MATEKIPVPCGKCPNCVARKTSGWSFRLLKQEQVSESALFVTLTYNTEHVPITKNGYMSLDKIHVQNFFKRLRKISEYKLKYYAVGEYGTERTRPHYHIILFNAKKRDIESAWRLNNKSLGSIYIGNVSGASVGYTLKYLSKPGKIPQHKNDDRKPEFQLMSKGLGKNYLTEQMITWHKDILEERMYVPMQDNKKIAMPRYYKDKIYNESEKNRISRHIEKILEEENTKLEIEHGENVYNYLAQQHINQFRKMYKNSKNGQKI
jgi:hypothetical protein